MNKTRSVALTIVLSLVWAAPATAASEGKALYVAKCAMCHGQDGVPKKMGAGSKAFGDPEFKKSATVGSIVSNIISAPRTMNSTNSGSQSPVPITI